MKFVKCTQFPYFYKKSPKLPGKEMFSIIGPTVLIVNESNPGTPISMQIPIKFCPVVVISILFHVPFDAK